MIARILSWVARRCLNTKAVLSLIVNLVIEVCDRNDCSALQINYRAGNEVVALLSRIIPVQELRDVVDFDNGPPTLECNICTNQFEPKESNQCPSCGSTDVKIAFVPSRGDE